MKPELKAKWVSALRSGQYKQGKNMLHNLDADTYCCYGVLRHIVDPSDKRSHSGSCLTVDQMEAYGFDPMFPRHVLENMNDGITKGGESAKQWTFPEIATYIEANL